jgi:hydrogenase small subunit
MTKNASIEQRLEQQGISRRSFLKFCALMGATLAVPAVAPSLVGAMANSPLDTAAWPGASPAATTQRIVEALSAASSRPPLVWLAFQTCTGDSESFLRSSKPDVATILLETLSVNYHETLMVPSGKLATKSLTDTVSQYAGKYIAVIEGSIPTANNGFYCAVGGRSALSIVREVCGKAAATISVGSCSSSGGIAAAAPNPTGAVVVQGAVPGLKNFVSLPGCPMNVTNLAAVIVHYLTYNALPELDRQARPVFAYGSLVHDKCPRRPHFDAGEFVQEWGDQHHRDGWCLLKMGCRGPETRSNCPTVQWNEGTNWPVGAGHPCIGCTGAGFWDAESPFYIPLPI